MRNGQAIGTVGAVPARGGWVRDWQHWAPYAAVAWSLIYAILGVYWAVGGGEFPYPPETASDVLAPLLGRFGPGVARIVVMMTGIPLGMSEEYLRWGQERGIWISGLFLASFGLVGAVLMLGLAQRWGEAFPRWMIGLAGRRVPIALAVVSASFVSVLLIVGGIGIWSVLDQMVANLAAAGVEGIGLSGAILFQLGPTLLFPIWGIALAVATLGYYYRRRGPCSVCGRGTSGETSKPSRAQR